MHICLLSSKLPIPYQRFWLCFLTSRRWDYLKSVNSGLIVPILQQPKISAAKLDSQGKKTDLKFLLKISGPYYKWLVPSRRGSQGRSLLSKLLRSDVSWTESPSTGNCAGQMRLGGGGGFWTGIWVWGFGPWNPDPVQGWLKAVNFANLSSNTTKLKLILLEALENLEQYYTRAALKQNCSRFLHPSETLWETYQAFMVFKFGPFG